MEEITLREILQKARRKKMSYDINEKTLEMIDEMAGILGVSRSRMTDVLLIQGIFAHTNLSINEWEHTKRDKEYDGKREEIEKIMKKMREFKKKWAIGELVNH